MSAFSLKKMCLVVAGTVCAVLLLSAARAEANGPSAIPWHLDRVDQYIGFDNVFNDDCEDPFIPFEPPDDDCAGQDVTIWVVANWFYDNPQFYNYGVGYGDSSELHGPPPHLSDPECLEPWNPPCEIIYNCPSEYIGSMYAMLAGGRDYSVAPRVSVRTVEAADCNGISSLQLVMNALDSVHQSIMAIRSDDPTRRDVVLLNIGSARQGNAAYRNKVRDLLDDDITIVASAGNGGGDACDYIPGHLNRVITVGAANWNDQVSWFSNTGSCVDIFAPGEMIDSGVYPTTNGTSTAASIVAGAAALCLKRPGVITPSDVMQCLLANATHDVLYSVPAGTINAYLNVQNISSYTP